MQKMLPAHQYKIGSKTYGLTQGDNSELHEFINSAHKKTYKELYELYRDTFAYPTKEVSELLQAFAEREESGKTPIFKHRSN
jgi:hypothetical protein